MSWCTWPWESGVSETKIQSIARACEQDVRSRGRTLGQSHGVAEAGVAESPRCIAGARIQVEIARDHESRPVDVLAAVRKDLVQLPEREVRRRLCSPGEDCRSPPCARK